MGARKVQNLNGGDYISFDDISVNVLHIIFGNVLINSRQSISVACCETLSNLSFLIGNMK